MIWRLATRADPAAALVADRHYSRQKPGTPQFMPTGSALVLYSNINGQEAVWGTSWPLEEYTKHEWAGAWACTIFRNETMARASGMIRDAVAATRFHYGEPPAQGMVTFVDEAAVRDKSHPVIERWNRPYGGFNYRLTPLGLAVRTHLEKESKK